MNICSTGSLFDHFSLPRIRLEHSFCYLFLLSDSSFLIHAIDHYQVSQAMSKNFVKIPSTMTLKEAKKCMHDRQQNCVLVVDAEDLLEGILTYGDIKRYLSKKFMESPESDSSLPDVCNVELCHLYS